MSTVNLGQLSSIPRELSHKVIELLPKEVIELNIEILTHHPELTAILHEKLREETCEPDAWYGFVAAYCGIVLDGAYDQKYLQEQLYKALISKRAIVQIGESINTVPVVSPFVGEIREGE